MTVVMTMVNCRVVTNTLFALIKDPRYSMENTAFGGTATRTPTPEVGGKKLLQPAWEELAPAALGLH